MKPPLSVSVIIVNYNGYSYVDACIESIQKARMPSHEIIVVDNGSPEGDAAKLRKKYAKAITVIALSKNLGPAHARNVGAQKARGTYLAFLDNDTIVEAAWAKEAVKAFESDPKLGIIQCKIFLQTPPRHIDYVGDYLASNGFLIQIAPLGSPDKPSYKKPYDIFAAKSAGMFIRRDVFETINGFDDDYFIYVEETDLSWRCWLAGYRARYIPTSVIHHTFGTSAKILPGKQHDYNAKFHGSKNHTQTIIKNASTTTMIWMLPQHIGAWMGLALYFVLRLRLRESSWILKGLSWNLLHFDRTLQKRSWIQHHRTISDDALFAKIMQHQSPWYFIKKILLRSKVGNAESF